MKRVLSGLLLGLCAAAFSEEDYRTFTGAEDGREIKVKIIKFDARSGKVVVERENRRRVTVPASVFSEADQAYIKEWVAAQDFLSSSKLRISIEKKKKKAGKGAPTKKPKPPCYYEIRMENRSATSFAALSVEYCLYKVNDRNSGGETLEIVSDKVSDVALRVESRRQIETKTVMLYRYYTEQHETEFGDPFSLPETYTSYNKTAEDDLEGIRLRVHYTSPSGAVFTREICEPDSLAGKYVWKEAPAAGDKFSRYDANGDGRVSLKEYLNGKKMDNGSRFSRNYASNLFKKFDSNHDGHLSPGEFK